MERMNYKNSNKPETLESMLSDFPVIDSADIAATHELSKENQTDHTYFDVVIIERDYKGQYERYALTLDEFSKAFAEELSEGMPAPTLDGDSFTLQPLVHMWYQTTMLGGDRWTKFFTDMSFDLPESDVAENNLAYIRNDLFQSLKDCLPTERDLSAELHSLYGDRHNRWHELQGAIEFHPELIDLCCKWLEIRDCQIFAAYNGISLDQSLLEGIYASNLERFGDLYEAAFEKAEEVFAEASAKPSLADQILSAKEQHQQQNKTQQSHCKVTFARTGGSDADAFDVYLTIILKDYNPEKYKDFLLDVDERILAYNKAAEIIGEEALSDYVIVSAEMVTESSIQKSQSR